MSLNDIVIFLAISNTVVCGMATSTASHKKVRWKSLLDFLAVAGPIICLIDCIVLPVVSALLPFVGMTKMAHGLSDQVMVFLVLAICLPIIVPGFLKHRSKRVLTLFCSAIVLMFFVNFAGVEFDEMVHTGISLVVAVLLIKANRENKKLLSCACSMHGPVVKAIADPSGVITLVLLDDDEADEYHNHMHSHDHDHSHGGHGNCSHSHSDNSAQFVELTKAPTSFRVTRNSTIQVSSIHDHSGCGSHGHDHDHSHDRPANTQSRVVALHPSGSETPTQGRPDLAEIAKILNFQPPQSKVDASHSGSSCCGGHAVEQPVHIIR